MAADCSIRFSIIVPTYNRLTLLQETLSSIAVQAARDSEVIVVDDGSSDGTERFLEYKAAEGILHAVYQKNRGPSAARNAGANAARGAWLVFLDSDDLWFPWTLAALKKTLAQYPSVSLVAFSFTEFSDFQELPYSDTEYGADARSDYLASSSDGYFAGAGMWAVRREAFARVGGFSEGMRYAEDHDFALRLGTEAGFAMVKRPIMVAHRRHGAGLTDHLGGVLAGVSALVERERAGWYPGGRERAADRHRIIARHCRAAIMSALAAGRTQEAWALYRTTFSWHLTDWRLRFLAAMPVIALWHAVQSSTAR